MIRMTTAFLIHSTLVCPYVPTEIISEVEAWKLGCPAMQGPHGNYQVPQTGIKQVDVLSKDRLVLESETKDFGQPILDVIA